MPLVGAARRTADRLAHCAPRTDRRAPRRQPVRDVDPPAAGTLPAAAAEEADVERAERRLVPAVLAVQLALPRLRTGLEDEARRIVQALGIVAVPRFDPGEVEQLRDARRGRREVPRRDSALLVELDAVEHVRADEPVLRRLAGEQPLAKALEPARVVQLVAVDAEDPHRLTGEALDQVVRRARVVDAVQRGRDRALGREPLEDLRRPVLRAVVDEDQLVAEAEDVPDRLLDEPVLVADERDPDDSHSDEFTSGAGRQARCGGAEGGAAARPASAPRRAPRGAATAAGREGRSGRAAPRRPRP